MFTQAFSVDVRNAGCDTTDLEMDFQESEQSEGFTGDYIEQSVPIKTAEQQPRVNCQKRYGHLRKFSKSYLLSFYKHARMSTEVGK